MRTSKALNRGCTLSAASCSGRLKARSFALAAWPPPRQIPRNQIEKEEAMGEHVVEVRAGAACGLAQSSAFKDHRRDMRIPASRRTRESNYRVRTPSCRNCSGNISQQHTWLELGTWIVRCGIKSGSHARADIAVKVENTPTRSGYTGDGPEKRCKFDEDTRLCRTLRQRHLEPGWHATIHGGRHLGRQ